MPIAIINLGLLGLVYARVFFRVFDGFVAYILYLYATHTTPNT